MNFGLLKKKLVGKRSFYKKVILVAIPIMIQNGVTNFVSLLDNVMIGKVGTNEMSGVAIVNQFVFVFNLCVFGGVAGAGIFTAQFHGAKNIKGVRDTFRFKIIITTFLSFLSIGIFLLFGENLIKLYLQGEGGRGVSVEETLSYAKVYLSYILFGLFPFAVTSAYADTLRCTGETVLPMKASTFSVIVNLFLNYILIYGKFGFPALGVAGAAIGTVVSRYAEAFVIIYWTHGHKKKNEFIKGAFKTLRIPLSLAKEMMKKDFPLLINEAMWSFGVAALIQNYSRRGLVVVGALNISQTIANLFNIVTIALSIAISIILGQKLGAGKMKEAKRDAVHLIVFTQFAVFLIGSFLFLIAPLFPKLYNTTEEIQALATILIRIGAVCMPIHAFETCCYFIIRSGGKTFITFLFDGFFACVVTLPLAFVLVNFTTLTMVSIYSLVLLSGLIKCVFGGYLVKKGVWLQKLA